MSEQKTDFKVLKSGVVLLIAMASLLETTMKMTGNLSLKKVLMKEKISGFLILKFLMMEQMNTCMQELLTREAPTCGALSMEQPGPMYFQKEVEIQTMKQS